MYYLFIHSRWFCCCSGYHGHTGGGRQARGAAMQCDAARPRQALHGVVVQGGRRYTALQVMNKTGKVNNRRTTIYNLF